VFNLTPDRIAMGLTSYVVLLFSISVHESAHAWMALRLGDDTAATQGRISLNPLRHIDPIGTLLIPLLQIFGPSGIPLLGWAKPTPVQARFFKQGYFARGQILVAGAGPVSNLILAFLFTAALFVAVRAGVPADLYLPVFVLIQTGVVMNVALAVFNLVPLPPLDGSWVASWGLPRSIAVHYDRIMEPYGNLILLVLFATGILSWITSPFIGALQSFLYWLALPG
jgi:Zn-dependent protease